MKAILHARDNFVPRHLSSMAKVACTVGHAQTLTHNCILPPSPAPFLHISDCNSMVCAPNPSALLSPFWRTYGLVRAHPEQQT
jgi:hypothetical protein